ncbi:hypothetical protein POM88_012098 [Heracleum sosnowskyi]|uniref:Uncharacterized protein n=1 Tax=Heracleum sosnowskyi TaxID=360622 RepID=A0AAD8IZ80_9APIA|nr:hypothetical protein POM88_012098 [Heracleum sosnowskyi]
MDSLDTYDAARLPVPAAVSRVVAGDPNQRQRFYVELVPGETTLVSWKELVQEANNEVVSVDSSGKALVQETNIEVVSRDSSDKALVQEAKNEDVSPDSFDLDQVIPFALVKRANNGPQPAAIDQQHA